MVWEPRQRRSGLAPSGRESGPLRSSGHMGRITSIRSSFPADVTAANGETP
jgi:hypothetical protein